MVPLMMDTCRPEETNCLYMTSHIHGPACDDECLVCHGEDEFPVYLESGDEKKQIGTGILKDDSTVVIHVLPENVRELNMPQLKGISYGRYGPFSDPIKVQKTTKESK